MPCPDVLSGFLKDGATGLDSLCSSGELHVLDVNLRSSATNFSDIKQLPAVKFTVNELKLTKVGSMSSMARRRLYMLCTFSYFIRLCGAQVTGTVMFQFKKITGGLMVRSELKDSPPRNRRMRNTAACFSSVELKWRVRKC